MKRINGRLVEEYNIPKKEAKLVVTMAKNVAFESLYTSLDSKGGTKILKG